MHNLTEFLSKHHFHFSPDFSGKYQHFDRNGKRGNAWAVGASISSPGGKTYYRLRMGDFATGEVFEWASSVDPEDAASTHQMWEEKAKKDAEEKTQEQLEAAEKVAAYWETCIDRAAAKASPYLERKKIDKLLGARIDPYFVDTLVVPARDKHGKLWGVQRILPDGSKFFSVKKLDSGDITGFRIKGMFHVIGEHTQEGVIYVAEGFATAASIHLATGHPCIVGFNAGNLCEVARTMRELYPDARITICGDNDQWTKRPDGSVWNPGKEAAKKAAAECGGVAVLPVFPDELLESKPTDYNDLHCLVGIEEVRRQLDSVGRGAGDTQTAINASSMVIPPSKPGGKAKLPPPQMIADRLLEAYKHKLVKLEEDLFVYAGTHWKHLSMADIDQIKCQIQDLCGGLATIDQISGVFGLFRMGLSCPPEGVNLFQPQPFAVNFLNGTLFIDQGFSKEGTAYSLRFTEHKPEHWMINVLPYNYSPDWSERNQEFDDMLKRVTEGEPDQEQKILAIRQMFGACLLPAFPHLFFLWGEPGTGKSTIMKIAARLVHGDNLCSVEPKDFSGFGMETMAGKLVNIDTDVDVSQPIADSILKKIEDRVNMRIQRKKLRDIYAPLPATHIFGGNEIPKTLEGISRAHNRRWTFIGFHRVMTKGGNYNKEYAAWCFEQCPQGVLNFALEGLRDIVTKGGHFLNPESGKAKMEEWQLRTDVVGQFLRDIDEGEVLDGNTKITLEKDAKIERAKFWKCFCAWHQEAMNSAPKLGRTTFFDRVVMKGIEVKKIKGVMYFKGLGASSGVESVC